MRLLIVDHYPLFRQGVRGALAAEPRFDIVGEASTAAEARRLALAVRPELLLSSTHLPDGTGVDLARTLKRALPALNVVFLATDDDDETLFGALRVGALGYFLKDTPAETLVAGLRRVARGEWLLTEDAAERPALATRVLRRFHDQSAEVAELRPLLVPLSAREVEILEQIARGNNNALSARDEMRGDPAVKRHMTSILRKLAVNDRTGAVVYALRQG